MKKNIILSVLMATCSALSAADYFVSAQGGLWSATTTWKGGKIPVAPIALRMGEYSGNLEVDGNRKIQNWSVWAKAHNIHLLKDSTLTLGKTGFNQQQVSTCVSGEGFFKCQSDTLIGYGGNKGIVYFVSNVELNKIAFDNSRKLLKDLTISMRQPIDRIFKTTLIRDGLYSDLSITGLPKVKTKVELKGNTTIGDIDISNNANVVIDTARLFLSGRYRKIEVNNSRLELVGKGLAYSISSKVRLNGNATLVLTGNNPYENFVNIIFNAGKTNTLVVNGKASLKGFCVYNAGTPTGRTIKIVLPKKSSGIVLALENIIFQPNTPLCLKTGSLSKVGNGNSVSDISIEIENFRNGAISVGNGFTDSADYAKIKAKGWKDFRLQNGVLTATKM